MLDPGGKSMQNARGRVRMATVKFIRGSTWKGGWRLEEKCDGAIVRRVGSERGGREDVERRDGTKATSWKGREGEGRRSCRRWREGRRRR